MIPAFTFQDPAQGDRAREAVTALIDAIRARGGTVTFERGTLFRGFVMRAELGDFRHTGAIYDNDFRGFLTAIHEMGVFFAHRLGKLDHDEAQRHLTRDVAKP